MKRVIFYSSVKDVALLRVTGFYSTDINILQDLGFEVKLSCSFWDFFKFWKYDIVFIYFWSKGLIPAVIGKIFSKKIIFTGGIDRLDVEYNKSRLDYIIRKHVFRLCTLFSDANIIVSKSDLKNIYNTGFNIKNIYYIPHVIEFNKYVYDESGKENFITTVVWMGEKENVVRKGVDRMLRVFSEFLKFNQEYRINIIGSIGEGTDYLIEEAIRLKIKDNVCFLGRISEDEKIDYLKKSKFYFQLSQYEGFGIAALEALAAGNIVFHSGKGGLADGISSNGILCENADNYLRIAEKLFQLHQEYSSQGEFIENGIRHVEAKFSYSVRVDAISSVINSIFGQKHHLFRGR